MYTIINRDTREEIIYMCKINAFNIVLCVFNIMALFNYLPILLKKKKNRDNF